MTIKDYVYLAAVAVLLIAFGLYSYHEREVGEANLQHSIDAATLKAENDAQRQTKALQTKADAATQEALNAQKSLADYMDAHPVGDVRVCHAVSGGSPSVPTTATAPGTVAGAAAAAGDVRIVSASAPGPDIGRGLSAIVLAAGVLATDETEFQAR